MLKKIEIVLNFSILRASKALWGRKVQFECYQGNKSDRFFSWDGQGKNRMPE